MRLKSILALATISVAATVFAVDADIELCRIEVNSGTRGTLLSLPFTQVGGDGSQVELNKIVMPDNLVDGSILSATVGSTSYAWTLNNGAWESTTLVDGDRLSDSSGVDSLKRGVVFWVQRAGNAEDLAKPFYLYGKYCSAVDSEQAIAGGSAESPSYTRLGNPNAGNLDLVQLFAKEANASVPVNGDEIIWGSTAFIQGYVSYTWKVLKAGTGWARIEEYEDANGVGRQRWGLCESIILPPGQGFWYVRKASSSTSVTFGN